MTWEGIRYIKSDKNGNPLTDINGICVSDNRAIDPDHIGGYYDPIVNFYTKKESKGMAALQDATVIKVDYVSNNGVSLLLRDKTGGLVQLNLPFQVYVNFTWNNKGKLHSTPRGSVIRQTHGHAPRGSVIRQGQ